MTVLTKALATVAVGTTMLLAAGCGGNDNDLVGASTAPSSARSSSESLLLSSQEFPNRALRVELPKESVVAGFGNATGTTDNRNIQGPVTVTPAECVGAQQARSRSS